MGRGFAVLALAGLHHGEQSDGDEETGETEGVSRVERRRRVGNLSRRGGVKSRCDFTNRSRTRKVRQY